MEPPGLVRDRGTMEPLSSPGFSVWENNSVSLGVSQEKPLGIFTKGEEAIAEDLSHPLP